VVGDAWFTFVGALIPRPRLAAPTVEEKEMNEHYEQLKDQIEGYIRETDERYAAVIKRCNLNRRFRVWVPAVAASINVPSLCLHLYHLRYGWAVLDIGEMFFFAAINWYLWNRLLNVSRTTKKQLAAHKLWLRAELEKLNNYMGFE
jgi:hypothetical protein